LGNPEVDPAADVSADGGVRGYAQVESGERGRPLSIQVGIHGAEVLNISSITVMRDWNTGRAWLYREMGGMSLEPTKT
jgi:hypothetical protein